MEHKFVAKEPILTVIIRGEFVAKSLSSISRLKQNLGSHRFQDDCKVDIIMTQWLTRQDMD
jgi:hypothetical protein